MPSFEALKRIFTQGLAKLRLVNTSGNDINPATEDTLSSFKSDFDTKVPNPLTYDSNGNVQINVNAGLGWNSTDEYWTVGVKGSVGYESVVDAFKTVSKGKRWNNVVSYTTALAASASYTSSSFTAQDSSGNNYTEIRVFLYQEGSTNTSVKVQQSPDNLTWYDVPNESASLTTNGAVTLTGDIFMPYVRVVESNNDSSNAQTKNLLYIVLL